MYRAIIRPHFRRQLKRYLKKYRHLKDDIIITLENFDKRQHDPLGRSVYKVRLKSRDVPRGKSKTFRLIVLVIEVERFLVPITIYFKGERQDITKRELNNHLEIILFELKTQDLLRP